VHSDQDIIILDQKIWSSSLFFFLLLLFLLQNYSFVVISYWMVDKNVLKNSAQPIGFPVTYNPKNNTSTGT
jgi:hypothetical protein